MNICAIGTGANHMAFLSSQGNEFQECIVHAGQLVEICLVRCGQNSLVCVDDDNELAAYLPRAVSLKGQGRRHNAQDSFVVNICKASFI